MRKHLVGSLDVSIYAGNCLASGHLATFSLLPFPLFSLLIFCCTLFPFSYSSLTTHSLLKTSSFYPPPTFFISFFFQILCSLFSFLSCLVHYSYTRRLRLLLKFDQSNLFSFYLPIIWVSVNLSLFVCLLFLLR